MSCVGPACATVLVQRGIVLLEIGDEVNSTVRI